jgi:hypothetical protein
MKKSSNNQIQSVFSGNQVELTKQLPEFNSSSDFPADGFS